MNEGKSAGKNWVPLAWFVFVSLLLLLLLSAVYGIIQYKNNTDPWVKEAEVALVPLVGDDQYLATISRENSLTKTLDYQYAYEQDGKVLTQFTSNLYRQHDTTTPWHSGAITIQSDTIAAPHIDVLKCHADTCTGPDGITYREGQVRLDTYAPQPN